jgi:hypothetical protein
MCERRPTLAINNAGSDTRWASGELPPPRVRCAQRVDSASRANKGPAGVPVTLRAMRRGLWRPHPPNGRVRNVGPGVGFAGAGGKNVFPDLRPAAHLRIRSTPSHRGREVEDDEIRPEGPGTWPRVSRSRLNTVGLRFQGVAHESRVCFRLDQDRDQRQDRSWLGSCRVVALRFFSSQAKFLEEAWSEASRPEARSAPDLPLMLR